MTGSAYSLPERAYLSRPIAAGDSSARYWGKRIAVICALIWIAGFVLGFHTAVSLLTMFGFALSTIGMARPTIGIMGIGILCTMDSITRVFVLTGGLLRWNTFNYLLLIAIVLNFPLLLKRRELPTRLLQAFVLLLLLQLWLGPDMKAGVQHILGAVAFFGLLIYFVRAAKNPSIWPWLALVTGVVAALGGLLYFIRQDDLPYINRGAWSYLPLTALFATCLARSYPSNSRRLNNLLWLLVVVNIVWIVLSASRGGIATAAACLLYLVTGIPGISRRIMFVTAAALVGGVLASHFAEKEEYVMHRFNKSIDSSYSLSSRTSGRSDLVIGGWRIFQQHPILGVGTGGFGVAWKQLHDRKGLGAYAAGRESEAHSGWVKTLAEAGLPGILLHIAFVLSFFIVGLLTRQRSYAYLGLLVTTTLTVAFVSTEFQGKALWFFTAGAVVVIERERQRLQDLRRVLTTNPMPMRC